MNKKIKNFAVTAGLAAVSIHLVNKTLCYLSTINNLLDNTGGNYYEWRFGKIFYKKQGEGKPVLLIHDLNSNSSGYEWKKTAAHLAENHTVYTVDLLGCGRSDKPDFTYTNFLYVQMITDFIKNIIGEQADVIATGSSAAFAVMACNTGEDVIDRIIMVNPSSLSELARIPSKRTKTLKLLIQLPLTGTLLYNILQSAKYIGETFREKYFYNPEHVDELMVKTYCESAHTDKAHSKYLFASIKGRYTNANIIHCIGNITNSIFIISGDSDANSEEITEQYKKLAPAIESMTIPETKHLPQLEKPRETAEQIEIFLYREEVEE